MAGNANSGNRKDKLFRDALMMEFKEVEATDPTAPRSIRSIARKLISLADEGDIPAIKEVADRIEGKVPQGIIGGGEDDPAINIVNNIRRTIVDPNQNPDNPDSTGIPATSPARKT